MGRELYLISLATSEDSRTPRRSRNDSTAMQFVWLFLFFACGGSRQGSAGGRQSGGLVSWGASSRALFCRGEAAVALSAVCWLPRLFLWSLPFAPARLRAGPQYSLHRAAAASSQQGHSRFPPAGPCSCLPSSPPACRPPAAPCLLRILLL